MVVIDCIRMGASPPTVDVPHPDLARPSAFGKHGCIQCTDGCDRPRRGRYSPNTWNTIVPVLRVVQLEQQEPLPLAEHRLAARDGDGVRGRAHHHRLDVGLAVLALVPFVEVLGPDARGRRARSRPPRADQGPRGAAQVASAPSSHSFTTRAAVVWVQNATAHPSVTPASLIGPSQLVGQIDDGEPLRRPEVVVTVVDFTRPPRSSWLRTSCARHLPLPGSGASSAPAHSGRAVAACHGQEELEPRRRRPLALGPDAAAVSLHHRAGDRQTDPRPSPAAAGPRRVHAVEALEHEAEGARAGCPGRCPRPRSRTTRRGARPGPG